MNRSTLIAGIVGLSLFSACAVQKKAVEEPSDPGIFIARRAAIAQMMQNFQRVHFEFDSALITPDSSAALAENAQIMSRFGELAVEVQGHCDDIGSTEYNLTLGDRRAEAIRKYLVTAGASSARVTTISYGEERPLTLDETRDALAMNRRAEFRITIEAENEVKGTVEEAPIEPIVLEFGDEPPAPIASR